MTYNEVDFYGQKLISTANDTVTPGTLRRGYTAHDAAGNPIVGTYDGAVTDIVPLSVTGNGTYTAPAGEAYSPVTVALPVYDGTVTKRGGAYLTFSSEEEFTVSTNQIGWGGTLEYSTDAASWTAWTGAAINSSGGKLYLRGTGNTVMGTGIIMTANSGVACTGNIETLLDYATVAAGGHPVMGAGCFLNFFSGCTKLTRAPELPATTLAENCYKFMFWKCRSLVTPPALPATVLAYGCYRQMFEFCDVLSSVPAFPATQLVAECYWSMFFGCPNIQFSATQTAECPYEFRIPTSGTGTAPTGVYCLDDMFQATTGFFNQNGTPEINTTYYTNNPPVGAT